MIKAADILAATSIRAIQHCSVVAACPHTPPRTFQVHFYVGESQAVFYAHLQFGSVTGESGFLIWKSACV